jgi:hypothetical protein
LLGCDKLRRGSPFRGGDVERINRREAMCFRLGLCVCNEIGRRSDVLSGGREVVVVELLFRLLTVIVGLWDKLQTQHVASYKLARRIIDHVAGLHADLPYAPKGKNQDICIEESSSRGQWLFLCAPATPPLTDFRVNFFGCEQSASLGNKLFAKLFEATPQCRFRRPKFLLFSELPECDFLRFRFAT